MTWWPTYAEVLRALRDDPDLDEVPEADALQDGVRGLRTGVPWFLKAALFLGGLFAGFVVACGCGPFLAVGMPILLAAPGALAIVAAVGARFARPDRLGEWLDPLLFSAVIGGTLLVGSGIGAQLGTSGVDRGLTLTAAAVLVLEGMLFLAYVDRIHRTLAVVVACGCLSAISMDLELWMLRDSVTGLATALAVATLAARPLFAGTPLRGLLGPAGVGFTIVSLVGMGRFWRGWADEGWIVVVGVATGVLALVVTGWTLFRVGADAKGWVVALVGALIVVLLGLGLPGLTVSLCFVLLALLSREASTLVLALVALVSYGSWAYTGFDFPVGWKAASLVGVGVVLLGLRAYLRWAVPAATHEDGEEAPDRGTLGQTSEEPA